MKISKNQNTIILEDKLYRAKEVTEEQIKEYPTLCNLCDLYLQDCKKAPCERSKRTDNKEIIFQFIRLINEKQKK
jgi:hypothetical protein